MEEALDSSRSSLEGVLQLIIRCAASIVLVIFTCGLLISYRINARFKPKSVPPGPWGLPIVGYLPFLGKYPHKALYNLSKKYGKVLSLKIGPSDVVVCNDWESMTDAFNKTTMLNRPDKIFDGIPNSLGFGSLNGSEWLEQRKFCVQVMKKLGYGEPEWERIIQEEIREAVVAIQKSKDYVVSLDELFTQCFTSSLMGLVLGCSLPPTHPTARSMSETVTIINKNIPGMTFRNFWPSLCDTLAKFGLYGSSETLLKAEELARLVEDKVKEQIQDDKNRDPHSFVKMYLEKMESNQENPGNTFTVSNLYGNSQMILMGGIDTIKSSMAWLLYAMADHQDLQSKVHQELHDVVGRDGEMTWSMRTKIPYTFACVYEVLRWKTTIPINPLRMSSVDTEILGYNVPKGTIIIANNWALHNDPRYWSDPEKFDPERFLKDGGTKVNSKLESFSQFSEGKRNCPGEQGALLNILLYFSSLVQKFKVLPENDKGVQCEPVLGMTYSPTKLKLRFVPRE